MPNHDHATPLSRPLSATALLLTLALPATGHASAWIQQFTGPYLTIATTSTTVPAFSGGSFGSTPVTGLEQFDPALGTLHNVSFAVEGSYDVEVSLFTSVIDESLEHLVDADVQFQVSLDVPTGGGGGLLFASGVGSANFFCSGGAFDAACSDDISPQPVSDSYLAAEDATLRLKDGGLLSLFVGNGELDFLTLRFFQFGDAVFFNAADNIDTDTFFSDAAFTVGPTSVTVTYGFVPAPVPLPPAAWLAAPAALALVRARRRH